MNEQRSLKQDTPYTLDEPMQAWHPFGDDVWLTRLEIAEKIGRSKTPGLIAIIGILVGMGYLETRLVALPNRVDMFQYRPTRRWWEDGQHTKF